MNPVHKCFPKELEMERGGEPEMKLGETSKVE